MISHRDAVVMDRNSVDEVYGSQKHFMMRSRLTSLLDRLNVSRFELGRRRPLGIPRPETAWMSRHIKQILS